MSDNRISDNAAQVRLDMDAMSGMSSGDILGLIGPVSAERQIVAAVAIRPSRVGPEAISKMDSGLVVGTFGSMPTAD